LSTIFLFVVFVFCLFCFFAIFCYVFCLFLDLDLTQFGGVRNFPTAEPPLEDTTFFRPAPYLPFGWEPQQRAKGFETMPSILPLSYE
jgi:hypothetical protein